MYIASPFYPTYYVDNLDCSWHINAPEYHEIRLTFSEFVLASSLQCIKEFVEIYDGDQQTGTSLGKFCGYIHPQFVQSTTNLMTVIFRSSNNKLQIGFKAMIAFVNGELWPI